MFIVKAIIVIIVLGTLSCEDLIRQEFKLIQPNGGEILKENNTEKIKWTGGDVDTISVSYDGGESWEKIVYRSYEGSISSPYEWSTDNIRKDHDSCLRKNNKR